jgi:hypothetical protein
MIVGDKLYLFTAQKTLVVQAGRAFKLLGTCALKERFDASPAFAPGRIFLRTDEHLYCVGRGSPPTPTERVGPAIAIPTPATEPIRDGIEQSWTLKDAELEADEKDPKTPLIKSTYRALVNGAAARVVVTRTPWWHVKSIRIETVQKGEGGKEVPVAYEVAPSAENLKGGNFGGAELQFAHRPLLFHKAIEARVVVEKAPGASAGRRVAVKAIQER